MNKAATGLYLRRASSVMANRTGPERRGGRGSSANAERKSFSARCFGRQPEHLGAGVTPGWNTPAPLDDEMHVLPPTTPKRETPARRNYRHSQVPLIALHQKGLFEIEAPGWAGGSEALPESPVIQAQNCLETQAGNPDASRGTDVDLTDRWRRGRVWSARKTPKCVAQAFDLDRVAGAAVRFRGLKRSS